MQARGIIPEGTIAVIKNPLICDVDQGVSGGCDTCGGGGREYKTLEFERPSRPAVYVLWMPRQVFKIENMLLGLRITTTAFTPRGLKTLCTAQTVDSRKLKNISIALFGGALRISEKDLAVIADMLGEKMPDKRDSIRQRLILQSRGGR